MSSNQHLGAEKTNGSRQQTTSTPYDPKPIITISPGSSNASFMATSRIRPSNNEDNHADSFALNLKVPNMTSLLNGASSASKVGNLTQSSVVDDHGADSNANTSREAFVRMSKVVINNNVIDEEIRVRENYLNQLKSIDLNKFSFPNENRPKTDYTYARSSSYLAESKHIADDSLGMPNLCRRSRRSPLSSAQNSVMSAITGLIRHATGSSTSSNQNADASTSTSPQSKAHQENKIQSQDTRHVEIIKTKESSKKRIGIYQSIKASVMNSSHKISGMVSIHSQTTTTTTTTRENCKNHPLQRNLKQYLEDSPRIVNSKQDTACNTTLFTAASTDMTPTSNRGRSSLLVDKSTAMSPNPIRGRAGISSGYQSDQRPVSLASLFSSKLFWLLIVFLLPAFLCGVQYYQEGEPLDIGELGRKFYLAPNQETIFYVRNTWEHTMSLARYVMKEFLPRANFVEKIKNKTEDITERTSSYIKELVDDYKPDLSSQLDISQLHLDLNQTKIVENLTALKEKLMGEFVSYFERHEAKPDTSETSQNSAIELLQRELEEKLNYTVELMYKKLSDHQRTQLSKFSSVLKELDTRFMSMMNKIQTQMSEKQPGSFDDESSVESRLKDSLKNENVSLKTIEEYVHQAFKVYDADKTGKADFASESLGASILFSLCTETYDDNSRYLTFLNFPITRITTSPRVVIQNSIHPGNCWPFRGQKGDLFIKLAAKITPTSFSIEHIPKELSISGKIDAAPQNFTVYGYETHFDTSMEKRMWLGSFRYEAESESLQFFEVQKSYSDTPISVVELKVESNWGHKDYTCLYKFRVHGNMFTPKLTEAPSQAKKDEL